MFGFSACTPLKKVILFDNNEVSVDKDLFELDKVHAISPGDLLVVNLQDVDLETYSFLLPNFNKIVNPNSSKYEKGLLVEKDGTLNIPFLDSLNVNGYTLTQLRDTLEFRYSKFIQKPNVEVKLLNLYVHILGDVKNPGKVMAEEESLTLLEAISKSGGLTITANRQKVKLLRVNENNEIDTYMIDLTATEAAYPKQIFLKRGDVVYVAESRKSFRRTDLQFISIILASVTNLLTIIVLLNRLQ